MEVISRWCAVWALVVALTAQSATAGLNIVSHPYTKLAWNVPGTGSTMIATFQGLGCGVHAPPGYFIKVQYNVDGNGGHGTAGAFATHELAMANNNFCSLTNTDSCGTIGGASLRREFMGRANCERFAPIRTRAEMLQFFVNETGNPLYQAMLDEEQGNDPGGLWAKWKSVYGASFTSNSGMFQQKDRPVMDLNRDGKVDADDYLLFRDVERMVGPQTWTQAAAMAPLADLDGDGIENRNDWSPALAAKWPVEWLDQTDPEKAALRTTHKLVTISGVDYYTRAEYDVTGDGIINGADLAAGSAWNGGQGGNPVAGNGYIGGGVGGWQLPDWDGDDLPNWSDPEPTVPREESPDDAEVEPAPSYFPQGHSLGVDTDGDGVEDDIDSHPLLACLSNDWDANCEDDTESDRDGDGVSDEEEILFAWWQHGIRPWQEGAWHLDPELHPTSVETAEMEEFEDRWKVSIRRTLGRIVTKTMRLSDWQTLNNSSLEMIDYGTESRASGTFYGELMYRVIDSANRVRLQVGAYDSQWTLHPFAEQAIEEGVPLTQKVPHRSCQRWRDFGEEYIRGLPEPEEGELSITAVFMFLPAGYPASGPGVPLARWGVQGSCGLSPFYQCRYHGFKVDEAGMRTPLGIGATEAAVFAYHPSIANAFSQWVDSAHQLSPDGRYHGLAGGGIEFGQEWEWPAWAVNAGFTSVGWAGSLPTHGLQRHVIYLEHPQWFVVAQLGESSPECNCGCEWDGVLGHCCLFESSEPLDAVEALSQRFPILTDNPPSGGVAGFFMSFGEWITGAEVEVDLDATGEDESQEAYDDLIAGFRQMVLMVFAWLFFRAVFRRLQSLGKGLRQADEEQLDGVQ